MLYQADFLCVAEVYNRFYNHFKAPGTCVQFLSSKDTSWLPADLPGTGVCAYAVSQVYMIPDNPRSVCCTVSPVVKICSVSFQGATKAVLK